MLNIGSRPFSRWLASAVVRVSFVKIAVCVKQVPDATATKRIDAGSKRLDRSGEGALNAFDVNAVEEALRIQEAHGGDKFAPQVCTNVN